MVSCDLRTLYGCYFDLRALCRSPTAPTRVFRRNYRDMSRLFLNEPRTLNPRLPWLISTSIVANGTDTTPWETILIQSRFNLSIQPETSGTLSRLFWKRTYGHPVMAQRTPPTQYGCSWSGGTMPRYISALALLPGHQILKNYRDTSRKFLERRSDLSFDRIYLQRPHSMWFRRFVNFMVAGDSKKPPFGRDKTSGTRPGSFSRANQASLSTEFIFRDNIRCGFKDS